MMPNDFIYKQIYKECLNNGVTENIARNTAVYGLERYQKGRYKGKPLDLIVECVRHAKQQK